MTMSKLTRGFETSDAKDLDQRNADRMQSLNRELEANEMAGTNDRIDRSFDRQDANPPQGDWAALEPLAVEAPNTSIEQRDAVAGSGATRTIAYDPGLAAAFGPAAKLAERYAENNPDAAAKKIWSQGRSKLGREAKALRKDGHEIQEIGGHPVHHRVWPKEEHRQHLLNAEMLIICDPAPQEGIGSGAPAHQQLHETYGVGGTTSQARIYREMAWGDIGDPASEQLMRMESFHNPRDRVPSFHENREDWDPLAEVARHLREAIDEYGAEAFGYQERVFDQQPATDADTEGMAPDRDDKTNGK
jgi:hypothetical protein